MVSESVVIEPDDRSAVRSFHRAVAQRIGALQEDYLARERSLGACRLLWEIGADGDDVRRLRERLGLDSGYLSRLLARLSDEGLVEVAADPDDGRRRRVLLTEAGAAELSLLDTRSDDIVDELLAPLTDRQRDEFVAAARRIDQLLAAARVTIEVTDPDDPEALACLDRYFTELDQRFPIGYDPDLGCAAPPEDMRPPDGTFLVARLDGAAVGCAGMRRVDDATAEVKRMWVAPSTRGLGLGRRLLDDVRRRSVAEGFDRLRLDTNHTLTEAIALYRSEGFVEVEAFNDDPFADRWFSLELG